MLDKPESDNVPPAFPFDEFVTFSPERESEPHRANDSANEPLPAAHGASAALSQEANQGTFLPLKTALPCSSSEDLMDASPRRDGVRRATQSLDWESYREVIQDLYNRMPLKEVIVHMAETYNFFATARMYKTRLNQWGVYKYVKSRDMEALVQRIQSGRDVPVLLEIDGKAVTRSKLARFSRRQGRSFGQGESSPPSRTNSISALSSHGQEVGLYDEGLQSSQGSFTSPEASPITFPSYFPDYRDPTATGLSSTSNRILPPPLPWSPPRPRKPLPSTRKLHSDMQRDTLQQALFLAMILSAIIKNVPLGNI